MPGAVPKSHACMPNGPLRVVRAGSSTSRKHRQSDWQYNGLRHFSLQRRLFLAAFFSDELDILNVLRCRIWMWTETHLQFEHSIVGFGDFVVASGFQFSYLLPNL